MGHKCKSNSKTFIISVFSALEVAYIYFGQKQKNSFNYLDTDQVINF